MRPLSRLAALSVLLLNACYPPGDGKPPPLDEIYFPTGLALDGRSLNANGASRYLYLANSDFDLQYRSSSLISYDLDALSAVVPRSCNTSADCPDDKACDAPGDERLPVGVDPTRNASYYCVAPALSGDGKLSVCDGSGERVEADQVLYPGRCNSLSATALKVDSVGIGAFAADVIWRPNCDALDENGECMHDPAGRSRLFIPVRGDSSLHWIDVLNDDDPQRQRSQFDCGQFNGDEDGCDAAHRAGDSPDVNNVHLDQPPEPFAIDATAGGEYIVITNQTQGSVSLYHNAWQPGVNGVGPKLVDIATGLPFAPVGIATVPEAKLALPKTTFAPSFLVSYRNAPQIDLLRVNETLDTPTDANQDGVLDNTLTVPNRYTLRRVASMPVNANSLNFDQRGIAIDDSPRLADYEKCQSTLAACGASADCEQAFAFCLKSAHQPTVFVGSRAPASMLVGAMTTDLNYESGTSELPSFTDSLPLSVGPSRVVVGKVRVPGNTFSDESGSFDLESRVFVVCFDSRRIFVYDPKKQAIEAIVSTGRGPHALAVDGERGLAYLAHFTDSYLGVISLDLRFPKTYAAIVASIGTPKAPRSSK
jgi:hypothetical protein